MPETGLVDVKLFSDAAIQKAVDDAMDKLGPDAKGGLLFHADLKGAGIMVTRAGEHWSVSLDAGINYTGKFEGQINIAAHW